MVGIEIMGQTLSWQRFYASLLALGAGFLLYRTIVLLSRGAWEIFMPWVVFLLLAELLIDLGCFLISVRWWIRNDSNAARPALRFGTAVVFMHAVRVMIFVMGRVGPWINFDVRPEHREMHYTRWTWTGVYFAAIMSALSIIAVFVIWHLIRRARKKQPYA